MKLPKQTDKRKKKQRIYTPSQIFQESQQQPLPKSQITKDKDKDEEIILPSFSQIQKCFQPLKLNLPNEEKDELLKEFYSNILKKLNRHQQPKIKFQHKVNIKLQHKIKLQSNVKLQGRVKYENLDVKTLDYSPIDGGIKKTFEKDTGIPTTFINSQDQYRFNQKRLVAKAFCQRYYGYGAVEQLLTQQQHQIFIDRITYRPIVEQLATGILRKIQRFLIDDCQIDIKTINRYNTRMMFSVILNCRSMLKQEHSTTIIKFAEALFGLNTVTISEQQAIICYKAIRQSMRQRMKIFYNKQLDHLDTNLNIQQKLQEIQDLNINNTKLLSYYFRKKFPNHYNIFSADSLRNKMIRIIRQSLKKLNQAYMKLQQRNIIKLVRLNDEKSRYISRSTYGTQIRRKLLTFFKQTETTTPQIVALIEDLNKYVIGKFPHCDFVNQEPKQENISKSNKQISAELIPIVKDIKQIIMKKNKKSKYKSKKQKLTKLEEGLIFLSEKADASMIDPGEQIQFANFENTSYNEQQKWMQSQISKQMEKQQSIEQQIYYNTQLSHNPIIAQANLLSLPALQIEVQKQSKNIQKPVVKQKVKKRKKINKDYVLANPSFIYEYKGINQQPTVKKQVDWQAIGYFSREQQEQ